MLTSVAAGLLYPAILALVGWIVQVQSRVAVIEAEVQGLRDLIEEKFEGLEKNLEFKHTVNERRLDRIERSLNGSLFKH